MKLPPRNVRKTLAKHWRAETSRYIYTMYDATLGTQELMPFEPFFILQRVSKSPSSTLKSEQMLVSYRTYQNLFL